MIMCMEEEGEEEEGGIGRRRGRMDGEGWGVEGGKRVWKGRSIGFCKTVL